MQANQLLKRSPGALLLVIAASFLILFSSCNNNKSDKTLLAGSGCLTLTNTQLGDWFPAYSNPSDPVANQISVLKFYPVISSGDTGYSVTVKAFNSANTQLGNELTLNSGICELPVPLPGLGQRYEVWLSDLNILKQDGSLMDNLTELIFTPSTNTGANLIQFSVSAKIDGVSMARGDVLPCPPCVNCRPPCPSDCIPACDSTGMQDTMMMKLDTGAKKQQ